jgi:hypothetical protein
LCRLPCRRALRGGCGTMETISNSISLREMRTRPRPAKPPCAAAPLMAEEKVKNSVSQPYNCSSWVPHSRGLDARHYSNSGVTRLSHPDAFDYSYFRHSYPDAHDLYLEFSARTLCKRQRPDTHAVSEIKQQVLATGGYSYRATCMTWDTMAVLTRSLQQ